MHNRFNIRIGQIIEKTIYMIPYNLVLVKRSMLICLILGLGSCIDDNELEERTWQLVWQDEFDVDGTIDGTKWTYDLGAGGWGNNELQSYTNDTGNVEVTNGNLMITAKKDPFTSARIKTQGLFSQAYGRFEARIKMPWGPGIWPAFWLLGENIDTVGWPQCGEIDVMEYRGQEPNIIHGSVHGPGYSAGEAITKGYGFENSRYDLDFHVFAIEWGADYVDYYVDETLYQRITPDDVTGEWVYDHPFFIILNVAVGGDYVGFPTDDTPFPQTMFIDWVRVYKEVK